MVILVVMSFDPVALPQHIIKPLPNFTTFLFVAGVVIGAIELHFNFPDSIVLLAILEFTMSPSGIGGTIVFPYLSNIDMPDLVRFRMTQEFLRS